MTAPGITSLLDASPARGTPGGVRRRAVLIPIAAAATVLVLWGSLAPVSGAVVAGARIKSELGRKTVQHREGGIVREIKVRNGQKVQAGDVLVMVEDARSDAELALLEDQLRAERVRHARVTAETTLASVLAPDFDHEFAADARSAEYVEREKAQFVAHRRTLDEQLVALQRQSDDVRAQSAALDQQIDSVTEAGRLAGEELALNQKLSTDGYIPRARLLQLQRADADARAQLGAARSDQALARQRGSDLQARVADARNRYQQAATEELRQSAAHLRELEERLRPSKDQVQRLAIRSPVDGLVMGLRVSSAGEVLAAGAPIADVVPSNEILVVEARIRPQDINHVYADAHARVRLAAFDSRTTPMLPGRVTFVSPDRMTDAQTGESWFSATVEVDTAALAHHPEIQLKAGMPAELFVTTRDRSVVEYLLSPITAFTNRALRET